MGSGPSVPGQQVLDEWVAHVMRHDDDYDCDDDVDYDDGDHADVVVVDADENYDDCA